MCARKLYYVMTKPAACLFQLGPSPDVVSPEARAGEGGERLGTSPDIAERVQKIEALLDPSPREPSPPKNLWFYKVRLQDCERQEQDTWIYANLGSGEVG